MSQTAAQLRRNKRWGADAEQSCADYLAANGFPLAERRHLMGIHDKGDISGVAQTMIEVKAEAAAHVQEWWREADSQRLTAGAMHSAVWWRPQRRPDPARAVVILDRHAFERLKREQGGRLEVLHPRSGGDIIDLADMADHDHAYEMQERQLFTADTVWCAWWPIGVRRVKEQAFFVSSAAQWVSVLRRCVGELP